MVNFELHFVFFKKILVPMIIIAGLILGCETVPEKNVALEEARASYLNVQSNPKIEAYAPIAMYEAKQALQKAEQAKDTEKINHLAYLADKQAQFAMAEAKRIMANKEVDILSQEKYNLLLEARSLEAQQLKSELSELQAKQTKRGIVLTIGDILFATGRADLMPGGLRSIDKIVAFLQKNPTRNVLIEGHTDSVGSKNYNLLLSQRRADAVAGALQVRGIKASRITTKGYGESFPLASNENTGGRQQNRRVEIIILNEGVCGDTMYH